MPEDLKRYTLSLESLARQGLSERTDPAIAELIENIRDPNTDATKPRKLTIQLVITPDRHRKQLEVAFDVTTTKARLTRHTMPGFLTIDPESKKPIIIAFDPEQGDMFRAAQEQAEGVTSIDSARKAQGAAS